MSTTLNNILSIEILFASLTYYDYDYMYMTYRINKCITTSYDGHSARCSNGKLITEKHKRYPNGKVITEKHRHYAKQEKKNKKIIDIAIKTAAMPMAADWLFYLDSLSGEEMQATLTVVKHALQVVFAYGLTYADVEKHHKRQQNKTDEPIRFIDRPHFIAVETDELPF